MRIPRSALFAGAATAYASVLIPRYPAGAAEFTYKAGCLVPASQPMASYWLKAAARIKNDSGGRMEVQVYPNSVLGGNLAMLDQVRIGAIEFYQMGDQVLASAVPGAGLDGLPFIFANSEEAWKACDGPLGKYERLAIEKSGLVAFDKIWDSSFHQVFNNVRPINTPEDLKGLKLRVPPAPVWFGMFKGLGAAPTPIDLTAAYTSLQTKLIDGVTFGYASAEGLKFYEVVKYASETNHVFSACTILGNAAAMQRLPKNLRDIVERRFNDAAIEERKANKNDDGGYLTQLKSQGMVYNKTNPAEFRTALQKAGMYSQWRSSFGTDAWAALEKSVGAFS